MLFFPRARNATWYTENITTGKKAYFQLDANYTRAPVPSNNKHPSKHVIIDGCSFVFGDGLPNEKTLASIIQARYPESDVYNISFMGGSPHISLQFHDNIDLSKTAPPEGTYIYAFFNQQLARWHLSPNYLSWIGVDIPVYQKNDSTYLQVSTIESLPKFQLMKYFRFIGLGQIYAEALASPEDRNIWSDDQIESFVDSIHEIKRKYLLRFPKGKFYLLIHPIGEDRDGSVRMKEFFKKRNIAMLLPSDDYWGYLKSINSNSFDFQIDHDGHPNHRFNKWLSDWLSENLFNMDVQN
jgi:hypothetical protein